MILSGSHQFSPIFKSVWNWFSLILNDSWWFSPILTNSQISLELIRIDSWISLNPDSRWFLVIRNDSWWFSNKSGIDSQISLNPDSQWFLPILTDSQISLELILIDSWISLNERESSGDISWFRDISKLVPWNPGYGTRNARGNFWSCQLTHRCNKAWCHEILVTAPEMQEEFYKFISVLQSSTELAHARNV